MNKQVITLKFLGIFLIIIGVFLKYQQSFLSKPFIIIGIIVGLISFGINAKNVLSKKDSK